MDKTEVFTILLSEMIEQTLTMRRECCDEDEQRLFDQLRALGKQADAVTARLPPEDQRVLAERSSKLDQLADRENRYLYVQGAKDCVKLLKTLGLLGPADT